MNGQNVRTRFNGGDFIINMKITPLDPIPKEQIKTLGQLNQYRFVFDYCFDFAFIAAAIVLSEYFYFNWLAYLVAIIIIGSRINALTVLMHDTAHFRAFRNRKLNHIFGEPISWLVLASMEGYRRKHVPHHSRLNTLDDPDWTRKIADPAYQYPKSLQGFIKDVIIQFSGIGYIGLAKEMLKSKELNSISKRLKIARACFYVSILAICFYTNTLDKLVLYWLVPIITMFNGLLWLRSLSEHYGNLGYDHPYNYSRTTLVNGLEAFILSPHNINYHIEHHLYPNVPYYHLEKLHKLLMEQPTFSSKAHITQGILKGLFKEILAPVHGPTFAQMVAMQKDVATS